MRPIDADALAITVALYMAENAYLNDTALDVLKKVAKWIEEEPTLDLAPVVHGEWEERTRRLSWCDDDVDIYFVCSACNEENYGETLFCPNCGAKMDGGKKDG